MYGFAREIFLRLVLHNDVLAANFHLHRLFLAQFGDGILGGKVLDAGGNAQVFQVVMDEVDGIFGLSVANGSQGNCQTFVLESQFLR